MDSISTFFSPGKLLLTSEYFVLDGALALAVPTKLGQQLDCIINNDNAGKIFWTAMHLDKPWLQMEIDIRSWKIGESNLDEAGKFISTVLQQLNALADNIFSDNFSYHFKTNLQFPPDFGWGSSSTLMNNLAEWAQVDPYLLNSKCLGGSGYDIAVAHMNQAVFYQNLENEERSVQSVDFNPTFCKDLILVHLNKKQNSRDGIALYKSKEKSISLIQEFTTLTKQIYSASELPEFSKLMEIHEQKVSTFLNIPTVKEKYFDDCPVFIKSLGAWGGDFVLSAQFENYKTYFENRGFSKIFDWNDIIA